MMYGGKMYCVWIDGIGENDKQIVLDEFIDQLNSSILSIWKKV